MGAGDEDRNGISPRLNIILLEVTMRALVCPSPLDLITNSPNRAISSVAPLGRWREDKGAGVGEGGDMAERDSHCQINRSL